MKPEGEFSATPMEGITCKMVSVGSYRNTWELSITFKIFYLLIDLSPAHESERYDGKNKITKKQRRMGEIMGERMGDNNVNWPEHQELGACNDDIKIEMSGE